MRLTGFNLALSGVTTIGDSINRKTTTTVCGPASVRDGLGNGPLFFIAAESRVSPTHARFFHNVPKIVYNAGANAIRAYTCVRRGSAWAPFLLSLALSFLGPRGRYYVPNERMEIGRRIRTTLFSRRALGGYRREEGDLLFLLLLLRSKRAPL